MFRLKFYFLIGGSIFALGVVLSRKKEHFTILQKEILKVKENLEKGLFKLQVERSYENFIEDIINKNIHSSHLKEKKPMRDPYDISKKI